MIFIYVCSAPEKFGYLCQLRSGQTLRHLSGLPTLWLADSLDVHPCFGFYSAP